MPQEYWTVRIPKPHRRWFRLRLKTMLLIATCLGVVGGLWARHVREQPGKLKIVRVYDLTSVFGPLGSRATGPVNWTQITADIRANAARGTWDLPGNEIGIFASNNSVVVSQSEKGHKSVEKYLNRLRSLP